MKVGNLVHKRWGRIDPKEQGQTGVVIEVTPGRAWTYITVSYPWGFKTYRASELEIVGDNNEI